jgi:uracil-DNA glycosylase
MSSRLEESLGTEWYNILKGEFEMPYMLKLREFLAIQKEIITVYPPANEVFTAYKLTPYSEVRVCIIGQDPYINSFEAMGLAFSTFNGQYTPSLRQIEKAVRRDVYGNDPNYKWYNNLTDWAKQGVFLLNTVLTVNAGQSGSHRGQGWEQFTLKTVLELDKKKIIFLLWGKDAQNAFKPYIRNSTVIECEHPQAANYQGRSWNNNNCFSKVNELLNDKIIW